MIKFRLKSFSDQDNLRIYHGFMKFESEALKGFSVYKDSPDSPLLLNPKKLNFDLIYLGYLGILNYYLLEKSGRLYIIHQPPGCLEDKEYQVKCEKPINQDDEREDLIAPYIHTYTDNLAIDLVQELFSLRKEELGKPNLTNNQKKAIIN